MCTYVHDMDDIRKASALQIPFECAQVDEIAHEHCSLSKVWTRHDANLILSWTAADLQIILELWLCATGSKRECVSVVQGEGQHEVALLPGQLALLVSLGSVQPTAKVAYCCDLNSCQCLQQQLV